MPNPIKMMPRGALIEKELKEQEEKTQFVGESAEFGKEVNRRLTEEGISIYEQIGIQSSLLSILKLKTSRHKSELKKTNITWGTNL